MMPGLQDYIDKGRPVGHFLTAVICNNLADAVGNADKENLKNLPAYVGFLYNQAPQECWGTKEKMKALMAVKNKERQAKMAAAD